MSIKVRAIALYLPQFHPIPENDRWWGEGFTEWENVKAAKPLFRGHYQPRVPADLGYYDLRDPEARQAQADLARRYGIEGFCYWHYWFGNGKKLLERPFEEVLRSGHPDFPFCLAWANHSWKQKLWNNDGKGDKLLIEQTYPGIEDYTAHFYNVLPAFRDKRYITVDGKPLFAVFVPLEFPDVSRFIAVWRELARQNGLSGIYFVGQGNHRICKQIIDLGFDACNNTSLLAVHERQNLLRRVWLQFKVRTLHRPRIYRYSEAMKYFSAPADSELDVIPSVFPNWDHSPRSGNKGIILTGSTPTLFKRHVQQVLERIRNKPEEHRIVMIKSWNEWGEGNYMEPDQKFGQGYLQAFREAVETFK